MKTDATSAGTGPQRAEVRGAQAPGQRWLADLERAWLEVRPAQPERGSFACSTSSMPSGEPRAAVPRTQVAAGTLTVEPASAAAPKPSHDATAGVLAGGGALATIPSTGLGPVVDSALPARPLDATAPPVGPGSIASSAMPDSATPMETVRPLESAPLSAAGGPTRASAFNAVSRGEEAVAAPVPERALNAPAYGRRLLQVSGSDELQINLRDAALTASQQEAVAHALFTQLGSTGAALRRVYLNGQRYEPQGHAPQDRTERTAPPAEPLRPTSILTDKE